MNDLGGIAALAGLLALLAAPGPALAQAGAPAAPWPEAAYNPKPAEGDFVLPMPCGGRMALRRVDTPTGPNPLEDRQVTLGIANAETDYVEYVRADAVAGGFRAKDGTRFFLIGKYEVTADQLQAVVGQRCPAPSVEGRLPATRLSWIDAVQFAHLYTMWLYKEAAAELPGRGGEKAFVRLPTEAEWEYAARGGAAVSEAEFRDRLFPMDDDVAKFAWFDGARSANGRMRPIGLLKPNPLGLHDMLGNAAEIVLEPFRLNKVGRLHGQAGGFTVRGGDFQTPEDRLRSSLRLELPPYDEATALPTRLPTTGFRITLAVPAVTELSEATQLGSAFADLSRSRLPASENPSDLLDAMIRQAEDPARQAALKAVAAGLAGEIRQRNEKEAGAIRSNIRMGTLLIRSLRDYDNRLKVVTDVIGDLEKVAKSDAAQRAQVEELRETLTGLKGAYDFTVSLYLDTLVQASQYDADRIEAEMAPVLDQYRKPGQSPKLPEWAQLFTRQTLEYQKSRTLDREAWLAAILR